MKYTVLYAHGGCMNCKTKLWLSLEQEFLHQLNK